MAKKKLYAGVTAMTLLTVGLGTPASAFAATSGDTNEVTTTTTVNETGTPGETNPGDVTPGDGTTGDGATAPDGDNSGQPDNKVPGDTETKPGTDENQPGTDEGKPNTDEGNPTPGENNPKPGTPGEDTPDPGTPPEDEPVTHLLTEEQILALPVGESDPGWTELWINTFKTIPSHLTDEGYTGADRGVTNKTLRGIAVKYAKAKFFKEYTDYWNLYGDYLRAGKIKTTQPRTPANLENLKQFAEISLSDSRNATVDSVWAAYRELVNVELNQDHHERVPVRGLFDVRSDSYQRINVEHTLDWYLVHGDDGIFEKKNLKPVTGEYVDQVNKEYYGDTLPKNGEFTFDNYKPAMQKSIDFFKLSRDYTDYLVNNLLGYPVKANVLNYLGLHGDVVLNSTWYWRGLTEYGDPVKNKQGVEAFLAHSENLPITDEFRDKLVELFKANGAEGELDKVQKLTTIPEALQAVAELAKNNEDDLTIPKPATPVVTEPGTTGPVAPGSDVVKPGTGDNNNGEGNNGKPGDNGTPGDNGNPGAVQPGAIIQPVLPGVVTPGATTGDNENNTGEVNDNNPVNTVAAPGDTVENNIAPVNEDVTNPASTGEQTNVNATSEQHLAYTGAATGSLTLLGLLATALGGLFITTRKKFIKE